MTEKKNPDYSASAINLCNPPEVVFRLLELHQAEEQVRDMEGIFENNETYKLLQEKRRFAEALKGQIKVMIDELGSYQDLNAGLYAVKQRRESITYKPDLVRQFAPPEVTYLVLVESVDKLMMEDLVKTKKIAPEVARQCGIVEEKYAYIVR